MEGFDAVVIAAGHQTAQLWPQAPLYPMKGQLLELGLMELPVQRVGSAYLVQRLDGTAVAGATYERYFSNEEPDLELALGVIGARLPEVRKIAIHGIQAGVRAMSRHRTPVVGRLDARTWVLSGLGSKGLLYHALLGQAIAVDVLGSNDRSPFTAAGFQSFVDNLDRNADSAGQPEEHREVLGIGKTSSA